MTEILDGQIMMAEAEAIGRADGKADDERQYAAFVEKFKAKKTTDDCYTPENIYQAVAGWVSKEYGVPLENMVRPFWPGGDYQKEEYKEGCAVVDNPPFSILAQIVDFYNDRGVNFFLFCPALTIMSNMRGDRIKKNCIVPTMSDIIYANGANVRTSFVTNMDKEYIYRSAPDLFQAVDIANRNNLSEIKKHVPQYRYPEEVLTGRENFSRYGVEFNVKRGKAVRISELDQQRHINKSIFGGGLLLSNSTAQAAAQAAAQVAAQAAADEYIWNLSDREKAICNILDGEEKTWGLLNDGAYIDN